MGVIYTLPAAVRATAKQLIDDLITEHGKDCLLVYPPLMTPCAECGGANAWVTGGPAPLPDAAACAACGGTGLHAESHTETVRMLVAYSPKDFFRPAGPGAQVPAGTIQTKTHVAHLTKLKQAQEMVLQPELQQVARWRYVLDSEPLDVGNIIRNEYVVCQWKRAG